ncbi:MAG: 3-dehydroquinate synthase [Clostridiales bacterium]|nr:3-dehydroquinate synthase [Clostridiales bacterium]
MTEYGRIRITAGAGYDVAVGGGLIDRCGEMIRYALPPSSGSCAVVTDSNVAPLYLDRALSSLRGAGFCPSPFVFPAGEKSKNLSVLSDILEFMASEGLDRGSFAVALGGGVTGDLAGFAAAVYMRGIRYVQMPTTLLAAVDSSVGGKTAVDLRGGKNLAGAFLQPSLVLCDTDTLTTLPAEHFSAGMAEALKTAVLFDPDLFAAISDGVAPCGCGAVIERCVALKGAVVERDEFEAGERRLLNLGHTVGHAIEKLSGFSVPHGFAVAAGTAVICRAGEKLGITDPGTASPVEAALERYRLPADTDYTAASLAAAAMSDKKRSGDRLTLVIPERIGRCVLKEIPAGELERIIELGKRGNG